MIYIIHVEKSIIKLGITNNLERRFNEHTKQFEGHDIKLINVLKRNIKILKQN